MRKVLLGCVLLLAACGIDATLQRDSHTFELQETLLPKAVAYAKRPKCPATVPCKDMVFLKEELVPTKNAAVDAMIALVTAIAAGQNTTIEQGNEDKAFSAFKETLAKVED